MWGWVLRALILLPEGSVMSAELKSEGGARATEGTKTDRVLQAWAIHGHPHQGSRQWTCVGLIICGTSGKGAANLWGIFVRRGKAVPERAGGPPSTHRGHRGLTMCHSALADGSWANGSRAVRAVGGQARRFAPCAAFSHFTTTPPAPCTPSTATMPGPRAAGPATVSSVLDGGGPDPGPR